MKNLSAKQIVVVAVLAFLTALEPLSIDLYLPGFINIAEYFNTTTAAVQISLSTFLGGFAVGQLLWGPLADKYGRKKPILVSVALFILASVGCILVKNIEQLWVMRFLQAMGGSGGVVIARAIVTDYFDKSKTLSIFALLALIMGVAPIIAPVLGNFVLEALGWEGLFEAMVVLGVAGFVITFFFLPETHKANSVKPKGNVLQGYLSILKNRTFVIYALIAGITNGALMIYVGNGPFIIMEKGGFPSGVFGLIFAVNAIGLMLSSSLTAVLQKRFSSQRLVVFAVAMMSVASVLLFSLMFAGTNIIYILVMLFFFVFPLGILFPTTTDLAMGMFSEENSGSASSLFGAIQLGLAFLLSVLAGVVANGTLWMVGVSFLACCMLLLALLLVDKRMRAGI